MGKLTVRQCVAAKPAARAYKLMDGAGLQLLVSTAGTKSWLIRYHVGGVERQYSVPQQFATATDDAHLSLNDARDLASKIRVLGKQNIDYQQRLKDEHQAEADARAQRERRPNFEQRFDEWERAALSKRRDGGAETRRAFAKDIFPAVGAKAMQDVTKADLMGVLDGIVARGAPRLANRCLGDLKQLLTWCVDRDIIAANPLATITKAKVGGNEEESDRILSEKELRALPSALKNANLKDTTQHAILLILGTAVRVGEVIRAKKSHIDLDARTWIIPSGNSKNSDAHTVNLSDFAAHHMLRLMELSDSEEWLMPARKRDGTETHVDLKSITKQVGDRQLKFFDREAHAKRSVRFANALVLVPDAEEPWSPHDLRRTAATLLQGLGVSGDTIEKCLNHREERKIKRIYQRHDYTNEKRDAWEKLGVRVDLLMRADADNVAILNPHAA